MPSSKPFKLPDTVDCVQPMLSNFLNKPEKAIVKTQPSGIRTNFEEVFTSCLNVLEYNSGNQERPFSLAENSDGDTSLKSKDLFSPKLPARLFAGKASANKCSTPTKKTKSEENPILRIIGSRCHAKGEKKKQILIDLDNKEKPVTVIPNKKDDDKSSCHPPKCKSSKRGHSMKASSNRVKNRLKNQDTFCPQMKGGSLTPPVSIIRIENPDSNTKKQQVKGLSSRKGTSKSGDESHSLDSLQLDVRDCTSDAKSLSSRESLDSCIPTNLAYIPKDSVVNAISVNSMEYLDKTSNDGRYSSHGNLERHSTQVSNRERPHEGRGQPKKQSSWTELDNEQSEHIYSCNDPNENNGSTRRTKSNKLTSVDMCHSRNRQVKHRRHINEEKIEIGECLPCSRHNTNNHAEAFLPVQGQHGSLSTKIHKRGQTTNAFQDSMIPKFDKFMCQNRNYHLQPPSNVHFSRENSDRGNKFPGKNCSNCGTAFCHPIQVLFTARTVRSYVKESFKDQSKYSDCMRGGLDSQGVIIHNIMKVKNPSEKNKVHHEPVPYMESRKDQLLEIPMHLLGARPCYDGVGLPREVESGNMSNSVITDDLDSLRKEALEMDSDTCEDLVTDKEEDRQATNDTNVQILKTHTKRLSIESATESNKIRSAQSIKNVQSKEACCPCVQLYLKGLHSSGHSYSDSSASKLSGGNSMFKLRDQVAKYPYETLASQELIWAKKFAKERLLERKFTAGSKLLGKYNVPIEYIPAVRVMKTPILAYHSNCHGGGCYSDITSDKDDLYVLGQKLLPKYFVPLKILSPVYQHQGVPIDDIGVAKDPGDLRELSGRDVNNGGLSTTSLDTGGKMTGLPRVSQRGGKGLNRPDSRAELILKHSSKHKIESRESLKHILKNADGDSGHRQDSNGSRKTVVFQSEVDIQPIGKNGSSDPSSTSNKSIDYNRESPLSESTSSSDMGSKTMLSWLKGLKDSFPSELIGGKTLRKCLNPPPVHSCREEVSGKGYTGKRRKIRSPSQKKSSDVSLCGEQLDYEDPDTGTRIIHELLDDE